MFTSGLSQERNIFFLTLLYVTVSVVQVWWYGRNNCRRMYCTSLHVFNNGSLAGQIFPEEVLEPYLRLFRGGYRSDILFMDDNARPHRANIVDEYLKLKTLSEYRGHWPAKFLDLNPMENLWDYLWKGIALRHPPSTDVKDRIAVGVEINLSTVVNNVTAGIKNAVICVFKLGEVTFHIKFISLNCFAERSLSHIITDFIVSYYSFMSYVVLLIFFHYIYLLFCYVYFHTNSSKFFIVFE